MRQDANMDPSRRVFLLASASAAGGLLLGCRTVDEAAAPAAIPAAASTPAASPGRFGIWLEIQPDGRIEIVTPQSEMGQGVHDSLPKILADELDADWSRVTVRMPWTDDRFITPVNKRHRTANSESILSYFVLLRQAGAAAREMLVAAAAARWNVPASECATADSQIVHRPSDRHLGYGDVAGAAASLPVPATPRLKAPAEFRLIGRTVPRKDTGPKCDGSAVFGIDVRREGMLYAALRRSPAVQSKLVSFDREGALKLPGVVDAFDLPDGSIAVIARSTWQAFKAAERLDAKFDESGVAEVSSEAMRRRMRAALDEDDSKAMPGGAFFSRQPFDRAKTQQAIAAAPIRREWIYEAPYLSHAALEPLTATAHFTGESIQVWAPSQHPDGVHALLAQLTGLPRDKCRMDVTFLGGGFGRKWELDFVRQAAQIAMRMKGTPVKLTWTREQDFQHDFFRPAHIVRTRVGLGRDGSIIAMHSRTTGISMWKFQGRALPPGRPDPYALGLLINDRYELPNIYTDFQETPFPVPVGTWRSVTLSMNGFFAESAMDDIAIATKQDPFEMRRKLATRDPRLRAVLEHAAEKAGWGTPLPKGRGRGIAVTAGFDAYCAQVVEVSLRGKAVKVERIVCAFDCGTVIDPGTVEAQVEGGIVWGLSAAIDGEINFEKGVPTATNFHESPLLRISGMPRIEVHLLRTEHKPGGAGEASVPPVASALAAAIHAAGGPRARRLPLIRSGLTFD